MDNLDPFLNSQDSLRNRGTNKFGYQFDAETERGAVGNLQLHNLAVTTAKIATAAITNAQIATAAIGTANIGTLSFNEIVGGTAKLGGTLNGNGLLRVFDASGGTISDSNNTGLHFYGTNGSELIRVNSSGFSAYGTNGTENVSITSAGLLLKNSSGGNVLAQLTSGGILVFQNNNLFFVSASGTTTMSAGATGSIGGIRQLGPGSVELAADSGHIRLVSNNTTCLEGRNGTVFVNSPINVGGSDKTAVVPTDQGYNALYCIESPEVWFMDFCESKDKVDSLFLEVTVPPYRFVKCEDGGYQVWGKRKGFEQKRFESKTKEEFEKNNKFWNQAKIDPSA